jgi:hypothetical protein
MSWVDAMVKWMRSLGTEQDPHDLRCKHHSSADVRALAICLLWSRKPAIAEGIGLPRPDEELNSEAEHIVLCVAHEHCIDAAAPFYEADRASESQWEEYIRKAVYNEADQIMKNAWPSAAA